MQDLLTRLENYVLVCDGAMGTMLYSKGVFISRCFDELNISNPELVREVHLDYIKAGADIIETNTFGANRTKLMTHGLADQIRHINIQGARIACDIAGDNILVAGAIGPLGIRIEPWGKTAIEEAQVTFREQAKALVDGGVHVLILETFFDLNEVYAAIRGVRDVTDRPLIVQMSIEEDGNSLEGTPPEVFAKRLEEWGADVLGLNCSVGPQIMLDAIERIANVTSKKLSVQPNAGKPRNVEGRNIYGLAGIHGVIREEICSIRSPDCRRLLRNDSAAYQGDSSRGEICGCHNIGTLTRRGSAAPPSPRGRGRRFRSAGIQIQSWPETGHKRIH